MDKSNLDKKILLINPKVVWINSPAYDRKWPPLSLANSAAILEKNGFDVEILDANAENKSSEYIINKSPYFEKVFITTSQLDKWQCPETKIETYLNLINNISKKNQNFYLIGVHGTIKPNEILKLTNAKAIIRGEPELTILDICLNKKLNEIDGITYKKNGKTVSNKNRKYLDLNKIPIPAFHLLPMEKYYYEIMGKKFTIFEGSRGCPFSCSYCLKSMYGTEYRKKPLEKMIEEIRYSIEKFGIKNAYFIDLEFCINKKLVESLCDYLIEKQYDFHWTCQTRFDSVDPGLIKKMKKAGCEIIHFGVESGSQRILDLINKGEIILQMKTVMKLMKKEKIKTVCFFMFGFPTETIEDRKMTIKLAKELNPTYASFHIAVPYPGTEFFNNVKNDINKEDLFPSHYGNKLELEKNRRKAVKSFYLRPRYILERIAKGDFSLIFKQIRLYFSYLNRGKG